MSGAGAGRRRMVLHRGKIIKKIKRRYLPILEDFE